MSFAPAWVVTTGLLTVLPQTNPGMMEKKWTAYCYYKWTNEGDLWKVHIENGVQLCAVFSFIFGDLSS